MERMEINLSIMTKDQLKKFIVKLDQENKKLEAENKKLKEECEENDYLVEDNARWMKKCEEKTMEIKKLKSDLAFERTMLDNVRAEYKSLQNVNKKLKEDVDYFRQSYLDLKKLCEKEGFMLSAEEVTKILLDKKI